MKQTLFILLFLSVYGNAQIIKDTVLGKPKFVKEYVVFLNDSGPFTFMKGDNEYGHATIMRPDNLRKRMSGSWFESDFCRYINNETYYDKNHNITKETWYYKSGEIVDDYDYTYDKLNRLITKKSKNSYSEHISRYFYEKDSKTFTFKEYYSKWKDEPMKKYVGKYENFQPMLTTKFDTITKTDSIFIITNDIWKKVGERSYTESKDSIYHKKLYQIKIYDNQYKVIEEKFFDYKSDYQNKLVSEKSHLKYEYDKLGNIIKQTVFTNGKISSFIIYDNGKMVKEENIYDEGTIFSKIYDYTKDQKRLKRNTFYKNNKIWHDINFEYGGNYITKLYYLDKFGREEEDIKPTVVTFRYTFDKHKNWTQIIKNIDGKDLYKWVREIKYYE
ncbi:hypothetical protein SAMN05421856_10234 [Chryseobacterium taichungense]|uniref:YD repeat-containing protein n=1 Tax=Chryseobacterium taichungense TaxID=295069 RepID=A0A1H7WXP1_9FLAO|nr:hypothetical protein [Chryseobacterium taichungense]SEM25697.1 hypothetical protein SAMN05421856_10234 [Chryseobacterium taichungense]